MLIVDSNKHSSLGAVLCQGNCNSTMMKAFLDFGEAARIALNASGLYSGAPGRAIWNDACIAHSQAYYGDYMDNAAWEVRVFSYHGTWPNF